MVSVHPAAGLEQCLRFLKWKLSFLKGYRLFCYLMHSVFDKLNFMRLKLLFTPQLTVQPPAYRMADDYSSVRKQIVGRFHEYEIQASSVYPHPVFLCQVYEAHIAVFLQPICQLLDIIVHSCRNYGFTAQAGEFTSQFKQCRAFTDDCSFFP